MITREDIRQATSYDLAAKPASYFNEYPKVAGPEVRAIEFTLATIRNDIVNEIKVLSWGVPGDMFHFSQYMRLLGIDHVWYCVDNYEPRRDIVSCRLLPNQHINIHQLDADYTMPWPSEKEFDFILVNGHQLEECLMTARKLVKDHGIIAYVAHDRTVEESGQKGSYYLGSNLWIEAACRTSKRTSSKNLTG